MIVADYKTRESGFPEDHNCLQEKCAWWSEELKQCDPTGLLPWVQSLAEATDDIREKLPQALRPWK